MPIFPLFEHGRRALGVQDLPMGLLALLALGEALFPPDGWLLKIVLMAAATLFFVWYIVVAVKRESSAETREAASSESNAVLRRIARTGQDELLLRLSKASSDISSVTRDYNMKQIELQYGQSSQSPYADALDLETLKTGAVLRFDGQYKDEVEHLIRAVSQEIPCDFSAISTILASGVATPSEIDAISSHLVEMHNALAEHLNAG